jgi:hypothetical protein
MISGGCLKAGGFASSVLAGTSMSETKVLSLICESAGAFLLLDKTAKQRMH